RSGTCLLLLCEIILAGSWRAGYPNGNPFLEGRYGYSRARRRPSPAGRRRAFGSGRTPLRRAPGSLRGALSAFVPASGTSGPRPHPARRQAERTATQDDRADRDAGGPETPPAATVRR